MEPLRVTSRPSLRKPVLVAAFRGWNEAWLAPEFRAWNIEEYLPGIRCPLLAIQGVDDEYATLAQIDAIERQVSGPFERLDLPECRHTPWRDQPDMVADAASIALTIL